AGVTRLGINPNNILGKRWWFSRVTEWDLSKPYEDQASIHKGACAARMPMLPHTVRYEEFERGHIDHAIGGALPRYLPGNPVFPAMGTDGRYVTGADGEEIREVPIYAGQRMRLRAEVLEELRDSLPPGSCRRITA